MGAGNAVSDRRAYPFRLEIAGLVVHGAVVASETEVAELLSRGLGAEPADASAPPAASEVPCDEPPPGRPSFDDVIDKAAESLGAQLDQCKSTAAAARLVLHHLAQRCDDADLLPSRRTAEIRLAERRRKRAEKDAETPAES